jgi:hypothetical protein
MSLETRLVALASAIAADIKTLLGRALPAGGAAGQVLAKSSATDYATQWVDPAAGGGATALADLSDVDVTDAPNGALLVYYGGVWEAEAFTNLSNMTFSGDINLAGAVRGSASAVAGVDLDCSQGNYFTKSVTEATTFSVSNVPASGAYFLTLRLTNGGSATITWPTAFKWPGGVAPQLTQSGVDLIVAVTDDGGVTWRAGALKDIK